MDVARNDDGKKKSGSQLLPWFIRQVVFLPLVRYKIRYSQISVEKPPQYILSIFGETHCPKIDLILRIKTEPAQLVGLCGRYEYFDVLLIF